MQITFYNTFLLNLIFTLNTLVNKLFTTLKSKTIKYNYICVLWA